MYLRSLTITGQNPNGLFAVLLARKRPALLAVSICGNRAPVSATEIPHLQKDRDGEELQ